MIAGSGHLNVPSPKSQLAGSAWKKAACFEERTQGEDVQNLGSDDIT